MKFIAIAGKWLLIICLPVLLVTASVTWAANSLWLYKYSFDEYGVSQTTELAQSELDKAAVGLIDYFNSDDEFISITVIKDGEPFELFNEREVAHLRDVKRLFQMVYRVCLGALAYALVYAGISLFWWRDRRRLAWGLAGGSCLTLVLMLALGLGALLSFDWLFWQFHLISFANDLWLLDPTRDYLIMLFPRGFWYDAMLLCALTTVVGALVLGGVGGWYLLSRRKRIA